MQVVLVVKNPSSNAGDARDTGSILGSGRSPEVGNGNPLQYSCLENSMDRAAWWVIVHRVIKSRTRLRTHVDTDIWHITDLDNCVCLCVCVYPKVSRTVWSVDRALNQGPEGLSSNPAQQLTSCVLRPSQCLLTFITCILKEEIQLSHGL